MSFHTEAELLQGLQEQLAEKSKLNSELSSRLKELKLEAEQVWLVSSTQNTTPLIFHENTTYDYIRLSTLTSGQHEHDGPSHDFTH